MNKKRGRGQPKKLTDKCFPVNVSMTNEVRDMADRDAKAVKLSRSAYIVGLIRKGSKK